MQYLGAKLLDLWIVREQQTCDGLWSVSFLAGLAVGRLRHQGDVVEAAAAVGGLAGRAVDVFL